MPDNFAIEQETKKIENKLTTIENDVQALTINNQLDYEKAEFLYGTIKEHIKMVNDTFDPMVKQSKLAYDTARDQKKKFFEPLSKNKEKVNSKMKDYQKRIEAEKIAERIKIEEERKRLEKEAEERQLEAAIKAEEARANQQTIDAIVNYKPPIKVESQIVTPKFDGREFRRNWKFRITDISLIPIEYWMVDEKKIGQVVRSLKAECNIPGIEVYED